MFEIAEIEEQNNNDSNARELYERIIEIDPKGYLATKAKERLAELDKKAAKSKQEQNWNCLGPYRLNFQQNHFIKDFRAKTPPSENPKSEARNPKQF